MNDICVYLGTSPFPLAPKGPKSSFQVCKTNWWALRTELIKLGDNEATPMLVIFLKDKDPYLRLYAAELLSHIGDKRALKDLREAGESDENSNVRKNAKWAYEQISGKKF